MIIYRFEYANGDGIYHGQENMPPKLESMLHSNPERKKHWPMPQNDKLLVEHFHQITGEKEINQNVFDRFLASAFHFSIFGFSSTKQIFNWFYSDEYWDEFKIIHIFIVEYNIPDNEVVTGDSQCLFPNGLHDKKHFIKSYTIQEFLQLHPRN